MTMKNKLVLLLLPLLLLVAVVNAEDVVNNEEILDATLSASLSGCGLCQQSGFCDHAFRNAPGQFCHTLVSGAPCCCPQDAQCVANIYNCRCRMTFHRQSSPVHPIRHSSSSTSSHVMLYVLLGLLLCVICCWMASRSRQEEEYCQPAYVATQYGTNANQSMSSYPSAPPAQPAYAYAQPAPVIVDNHTSDSGGAFAAGAVGAAAGLATGMLVGSAMGGGRRNDGDGNYAAGDTGFSTSEVTYEFSGDNGGGDYGGGYGNDDGGDFGGDS